MLMNPQPGRMIADSRGRSAVKMVGMATSSEDVKGCGAVDNDKDKPEACQLSAR